MPKPIIAVDIDDVLADHAAAFVTFSNTFYGTDLTPDQYIDNWDILWNISDMEEIERRAAQFHQPGSVAAYQVIAGAKDCLPQLAKNFRLVIVTARKKEFITETKTWLTMHFSGLFEETHFVPIWQPDNKVTKADICKQIRADYLIDDVPRHCNVAAAGGITALMFGLYGDNSSESVDSRVIRVKDWQAVEEFFDGRA